MHDPKAQIRDARWRRRHPDRVQARNRRYRLAHPHYWRHWYATHKAQRQAWEAQYRRHRKEQACAD